MSDDCRLTSVAVRSRDLTVDADGLQTPCSAMGGFFRPNVLRRRRGRLLAATTLYWRGRRGLGRRAVEARNKWPVRRVYIVDRLRSRPRRWPRSTACTERRCG